MLEHLKTKIFWKTYRYFLYKMEI